MLYNFLMFQLTTHVEVTHVKIKAHVIMVTYTHVTVKRAIVELTVKKISSHPLLITAPRTYESSHVHDSWTSPGGDLISPILLNMILM